MNVIDSLIVLLSLDPSGFKAGAKDSEKALKDTSEATDKRTKEIEAKAKVAAQAFGAIRNQVLALGAAVLGGIGMKEFAKQMTTADAALGRTATNIGVTTETLSAWQGVADRSGGTAAGLTGSMQNLSQQFQQLYLTGQSSVVPYFRTLGVSLTDSSGKMRNQSDIFLDLADKFSKMDPARAQALGRGMMLDEGTVNMLMKGRGALEQLLAEQAKIGAANKADAEAAAERQKAFNALTQAATDLGRKLLTELTPAILGLTKVLSSAAEWFAQHRNTFNALGVTVITIAGMMNVALAVLTTRGVLGLVASLGKVPAAAEVAGAAMETTAATANAATASVGTGLLGMLGKLAKSAALVAVAAEVGYTIGSALFDSFVKDTPLSDWIGRQITRAKAFFGDKEAQAALDAEEKLAKQKFANPPKTVQEADEQRTQAKGQPSADRSKEAPSRAPESASGRSREPGQATGAENSTKPGRDTVREATRETNNTVREATRETNNTVRETIRETFRTTTKEVAPGRGQTYTVVEPARDRSSARTPLPSPAAREQAQGDIKRFMEMGWTREQATGIVANIQRESAGNEKAVGDKGAAYGLAQWHPDRQREFFKQFGKDIRSATRDEQLQFIDHELRRGNEQGAGRELAKAKTAEQAAAVVATKYERPADTEGEAAKRANIATALYRPGPDPAMRGGAATSVAANTTNNSNVSTNTSHAEMHIGKVEVIAPNAKDAPSLAKGLSQELQKNMAFAQQATQGLI